MSAGALSAVRSPAFTAQDAARYRAAGWWCDSTLSDAVRRNAEQWPDRAAYIEFPDASLSWYQFDGAANALAQQLAGAGVARGDRVAVWLGDSAAVHILAVPAFTLAGGKVFLVEAHEVNGGRTLTLFIHNKTLLRAKKL